MERLRVASAIVVIMLISAPHSLKMAEAQEAIDLHLPTVSGPVPVTNSSRPFLEAREALEAVGYVEEEFFLSGQANVYEWARDGDPVTVKAGPGDYVTRILVRRPKEAEDFSGNVEVKVLNATRGYDYGLFTDFERMTRQGDAWIGVTSKPINVKALQRFDPERYAPLSWDNPAAPSKRCANPSFYPIYMTGGNWATRLLGGLGVVPKTSWPETEDGLLWDILGQLGLLLKSEERDKVMPGFSEPALFMTGISQSSIVIWTWMAGFHDLYRTPEGDPVYDGYLAIVGPALSRINQCSEDIPLDDPRQKLSPPDVPFIALYAEAEMWLGKYTRQPDAFTESGGIVTYEVAGAAHSAHEVPGVSRKVVGTPSAEDVELIAPRNLVDFSSMLSRILYRRSEPTDFAWQPVVRAAFQNLKLWANEGIRPPQAPGIKIDDAGEIVRDQYGNALGGVRLPYVEVPIASYRGNISDGGLGAILGTRERFSREVLETLYPDHQTYVSRFSAVVDRLVSERMLLPEDGQAMKEAARSEEL